MKPRPIPADVLRVGEVADASVVGLSRKFGVELRQFDAGEMLPGSYWGESEAGLRANVLSVRADTPLHSLLHELSHYVCMTPERRAGLDRDAGGDDEEDLRDISFDEAQLLAKEREQEILRAALARDLVALVMRRLAAL